MVSDASLIEVLEDPSSESEDKSSTIGPSMFVGLIPLFRVETFDVSVAPDAMDVPDHKCICFVDARLIYG